MVSWAGGGEVAERRGRFREGEAGSGEGVREDRVEDGEGESAAGDSPTILSECSDKLKADQQSRELDAVLVSSHNSLLACCFADLLGRYIQDIPTRSR